jgi:hypothetical protein
MRYGGAWYHLFFPFLSGEVCAPAMQREKEWVKVE